MIQNLTHHLKNSIFLLVGLVLIFGSNNISANESDSTRIEIIKSHIMANPINELPITNHPVYPERVFCRLFNISLSARTFFQLSTDPSLDKSSNEDIQKVARWYIDNPDKVRDLDAAYWAGEYHAAILSQYGSRGTIRKGAISRETELLLLEYMFDYVNYWSRLDLYDLSLEHETFQYWASENHWWQEIVTSWGYLLALKEDPEYKDLYMGDGSSIQEHYVRTSDYMKHHMNQRARKGFLNEISSGGYAMRMQNMWHLIYNISPDAELRDLAENTLDLWWAFWAEEQVSGERGGGKVRHRRLKGLMPNAEAHMIPAWLYFGIGSMDEAEIKKIGPDTIKLAVHYMGMFSGYRPDEIIYKILEERETVEPYAITQRRLAKSLLPYREFKPFITVKSAKYDYQNGEALKYSWVSPNYIIGTVMRPPHDAKVWHPGSAQGWWHGLLIKGEEIDSPPQRIVPTIINNNQIQSADYYGDQYAIQSKGSFMTRRLPDEFWGIDNRDLPMGIYISKGLQPYMTHTDDFISIRSPEAWVIIRAADTSFELQNDLLKKAHKNNGNFYRLKDENKPLIIEVVEVDSFANFNAFESAVKNADLAYESGSFRYKSLSGDELTMFDDRSNPEINGTKLNYNPSVAYESEFIQSEWDSGKITINAGGETKTLDFSLSNK